MIGWVHGRWGFDTLFMLLSVVAAVIFGGRLAVAAAATGGRVGAPAPAKA